MKLRNKIINFLYTFISLPLVGTVYLFEFFAIFSLFKRPPKLILPIFYTSFSLLIYIIFSEALTFSTERINWIGTIFLTYSGLLFFYQKDFRILLKDFGLTLLGLGFSFLLINDSLYFAKSSNLIVKIAGCFMPFFIYKSFYSKNKNIFIFLALLAIIILGDRLILISFSLSLFIKLSIQKNFFKNSIIFLFIFFLIGVFFTEYSDYSDRIVQKNKLALENSESSNNPITNYILGARADIIPMAIAISRKPVFGYGSDGLPTSFVNEMIKLNPLYSNTQKREMLYDRGIVLHSLILGHWVRYGLFGLFYALAILYYPLKILINFSKHSPYICFISLFLVSSIFFEPGRNRLNLILYLSLLLSYLNSYNLQINNDKR